MNTVNIMTWNNDNVNVNMLMINNNSDNVKRLHNMEFVNVYVFNMLIQFDLKRNKTKRNVNII